MKLTKRNILLLIKEACDLAPEEEPAQELPQMIPGLEELEAAAAVMPIEDPAEVTGGAPVPADYDSVTKLLNNNAWVVNLALEQVMEMSGAKCERSTVMAIIDFLKGMLGVDYRMGEPVSEPVEPLQMAPILYPSM